MDNMINNNDSTASPFDGVPLGFGMALAMNENALNGYAKLTEAQKEALINKSRDAKSKSEMQ